MRERGIGKKEKKMDRQEAVEQLRQIKHEKLVLMKYDQADSAEINKVLQRDIDALNYAIGQLDSKDHLPYVWIRGKLPTLNEYTKACRTNPHVGAKMKKDFEQNICYQLTRMPRITVPIIVHFEWHEKTKRRDKDNVAFAKKFILDAMQTAGKIPNDNNNFIAGFTDSFVYGDDYGCKIRIERCRE